ncbi:MAG: hypothetical protein QW439_02880 [Candidatus Woesearchaeota archaeon]
MKQNLTQREILLLFFIILLTHKILAAPSGPQILFNSTDYGPSGSSTIINTSGGTISTINLYGLTQNIRWKAFIGNVSGKLMLSDSSGYSIYDWSITSVSGEVYASRFNTIDWASIDCAQDINITSEEAALNISSSSDDSISRTFSKKVHRTFYVGVKPIQNSTCYSTATFVGNQSQAISEEMKFQEVLLAQANKLVYVALLENRSIGYNNQNFDFQMIVPDYGVPTGSNVPYYLYVELI